MNNFKKAVSLTLEAEGVLSDHPDDKGGLTKYGISKRAYPDLDIANITKEQAVAIYRRDYWDKCKCEVLPYPLDVWVFDTSVNHGVKKAVRILQETLGVATDGIIGPKTLNAANKAGADAVNTYALRRLYAYAETESWQTFKKGWLNRLIRLTRETA